MTAQARGHLPQSACQEQVSLAYAHAVASAAGCGFERRGVDQYGVDASFHHQSTALSYDPKQIEAQLKCTTRDALRDDHVIFGGLKRKHHESLRTNQVNVPRILIVMLVPTDMDDWLEQSETELLVSGCSYWVSLRDRPAVDSATTTVHVPRVNVFGIEALLNIMDRVGGGGLP